MDTFNKCKYFNNFRTISFLDTTHNSYSKSSPVHQISIPVRSLTSTNLFIIREQLFHWRKLKKKRKYENGCSTLVAHPHTNEILKNAFCNNNELYIPPKCVSSFTRCTIDKITMNQLNLHHHLLHIHNHAFWYIFTNSH